MTDMIDSSQYKMTSKKPCGTLPLHLLASSCSYLKTLVTCLPQILIFAAYNQQYGLAIQTNVCFIVSFSFMSYSFPFIEIQSNFVERHP
jgi:hypothetical protein